MSRMWSLCPPALKARLQFVSTLLVVEMGALLGFGCPASADDWPQWRGSQRNALSAETGLLSAWSEGEPRLAWQASGCGTGYSSVAVSRGRVFTLGRQAADVIVTAFNSESGHREWTRKIATTSRNPCSTPTVDRDFLYVLGPDGDLVCLRFASGEIVWQKSLVRDFEGKMMSGRGYGESPLIDGEKLIVTPGADKSAIVALDKRTGTLLWKSRLPVIGPAGREGAGFSSVVISEAAGVHQFVQLVGRGLIGVDARDGRLLWNYNPIANGTANIPTPVVRDNLVFAANGYNAGGVLLRLIPDVFSKPAAPAFKAEVVYTTGANEFQNHHGGVVLLGEHIYGGHGSNNGLPTCLEFLTGKVVWKRRGPGVGSAAVACADGRLYFRYQNGLVALLTASPAGYELQGTLQIPGAGGDSWAHPVVAQGRLYLREQDKLWVYDLHRNVAKPGPSEATTAAVELDVSLAALRKLGVVVEPLPVSVVGNHLVDSEQPRAIEAEKSRRLYRFAVDEPKGNKTGDARLVTLTSKQLTEAGTVVPAVLAELVRLNTPFVLNLAGTQIGDEGLRQLIPLSQVVGLNLESCGRFTDRGLEHLRHLPRLRTLILMGTGVTQVGLHHLVACPNLRAMDLEVCDGITDAACETLGTMRSLRALILKKTAFEPHCLTDAGLKSLKNLQDLEVLNLSGNRINNAGLAHLAGLVKLQELNLSLLAITDSGLMHLQKLQDLRQLDLLFSEGFAGPKITNNGLITLAQLASLTSLNLTGAQLSDDGLQPLHALNKLTSLRLTRTPISNAGIKILGKSLPKCRVVK